MKLVVGKKYMYKGRKDIVVIIKSIKNDNVIYNFNGSSYCDKETISGFKYLHEEIK